MFFLSLVLSSALAETPGFYVEPLLPNVEFAMVQPDGCTPANGCVTVVNTGGTMLALHNEYFPGPTQVVDGESYTVGVYLDRLPVVKHWDAVSPVTGKHVPTVDGSFVSVMPACVGTAKPTVHVDVGNATRVWLNATSVRFTKTIGLVGVDMARMKVLSADAAADAQEAYDARTGVLVKYYLGVGKLNGKMGGKPFVFRTSIGVAPGAETRAFGDGACIP